MNAPTKVCGTVAVFSGITYSTVTLGFNTPAVSVAYLKVLIVVGITVGVVVLTVVAGKAEIAATHSTFTSPTTTTCLEYVCSYNHTIRSPNGLFIIISLPLCLQ